MFSPPHSPLSHTQAPLHQRSTLTLPGQAGRYASTVGVSASSHPLRQTSFPASDFTVTRKASLDQSKDSSPADSFQDISDGEINNAVDVTPNVVVSSRKRKLGERKIRRDHKETNSVAHAAGRDDNRPTKRRSTITDPHAFPVEDHEADDDDDEDDDDAAHLGKSFIYDGGQMTNDELNEERGRKRVFYDSVDEVHRDRAEAYHRAKLRTADVRRLVNQTLSQSVPQNVVLAVASYTKLFAGQLIEGARSVQAEWVVLNRFVSQQEESESINEGHGGLSRSDLSRTSCIIACEEGGSNIGLTCSSANPSRVSMLEGIQTASGATDCHRLVAECDRGPLLPDHLRVALHKYKRSRCGGPVGYTGLSLEGRDVAASRMGGRRLFQ